MGLFFVSAFLRSAARVNLPSNPARTNNVSSPTRNDNNLGQIMEKTKRFEIMNWWKSRSQFKTLSLWRERERDEGRGREETKRYIYIYISEIFLKKNGISAQESETFERVSR